MTPNPDPRRAQELRNALSLERLAMLNELPTPEALRRVLIARVAVDALAGIATIGDLLNAIRSDPDDEEDFFTPPEPEPEPSAYSPDDDALWHDEGVAG